MIDVAFQESAFRYKHAVGNLKGLHQSRLDVVSGFLPPRPYFLQEQDH
jgi:hypothetical protein